MSEWILNLFQIVNGKQFSLLLLLNLFGFFLSSSIFSLNKKKNWFNWLLAYPRYLVDFLQALEKKRFSFTSLFLIIFLTNTGTMCMGFLFGFIPGLTYIFLFYLGLNLGLVQLLLLPNKPLWITLFNPIAIMEILSVTIAATLGLQLTLHSLGFLEWRLKLVYFHYLLRYIAYYPILILFIAGTLETWIILLSRKILPPMEGSNQNL